MLSNDTRAVVGNFYEWGSDINEFLLWILIEAGEIGACRVSRTFNKVSSNKSAGERVVVGVFPIVPPPCATNYWRSISNSAACRYGC